MQKPKLKDHYHVVLVEHEDLTFLLTEKGETVLPGELYLALVPLLTGEHTIPDIAERMNGKGNFMQVQYALSGLRRKGFIADYEETVAPEVAAYWNILDVDTPVAAQKLREKSVAVKAYGSLPTAPIIAILEGMGIQIAPEGQADATLVLADDYLQEGLAEFNQWAVANNHPWLIVKPVGAHIWIGPLFVPEKTGCWACMEQRLRLNHEIHTYLQTQKNTTKPFPISRAIVPSTMHMALNMAATEMLKWLIKEEAPEVEGYIIRYNTLEMKQDKHTLIKRPQCPVCGDPTPKTEPTPIELQSQIKRFTADGGHRVTTPEEMLKKYEHHVSELTGAVNYLDVRYEVPGLFYVYHAFNNFKVRYIRWTDLFNNRFQRSGGKGMTAMQAKASGLGEAIERYCGSLPGDEIRVPASYNEIKADAIHPTTMLQFSAQQYKDWEKWREIGMRHIVPKPFDEDKVFDWTPVWSLTENRFKYVPTGYLYYGYWKYEELADAFCWADSNGNASGNTIEEAILQGFMELVERDCIAMWWYNRIQRPEVDMDSFNVPYFRQLREFYASQGRELWMIDLTNDIGIPVFAGISYRPGSEDYEEVCVGYGAHFDPKIAASRALTEVNELLSAVLTTKVDKEKGDFRLDNEMRNWLVNTKISENDYLVPHPDLPIKRYEDYHYTPNADLRDDVLQGVEIMKNLGMEVLVLDQTYPDVGMSVVKVMVPGLRHFWARFAPGRLYDIPVKLGWLPEPLTEEQMNPVPMFF